MMQQGDSATSCYQFYQSQLQNPNPNPSFNPSDSSQATYASASAPPFPYDQYSYEYPDLVPNPPSFPHLTPNGPYDQNQTPLDYASFSRAPYGHRGDSTLLTCEDPYQSAASRRGGYFDGNAGSMVEPLGGRETGLEPSGKTAFDDYGRPICTSSGKDGVELASSDGNVNGIPKKGMEPGMKSGVQKFHVKLLAEDGGQSSIDVLCQIGFNGIQMLDPSSGRKLRIYPLETIMRWEVLDSSIFEFWAKSSIDIEDKRIRLQSNNYTTNIILDTLTAATVQVKEIGGRDEPSDSFKVSEQLSEKKKGFADWINLMKPSNEEKDHWVPDEVVTKCMACSTEFGAFVRKHHCRNCGEIFCDKCTQGRVALTADELAEPVRVCDQCMAEVTQRLSNSREASGKFSGLPSHKDLAKKLQEMLDRNHKTSSGLTSDRSMTQIREVECPTCTVHLQVQVPTIGSKTLECSVCQHPFLVNAH
ncbi:protein FREE1-like isoform X2 [Malania oleifera]|uniref:protein FREE1-like isoform X2 n=1 Tax=Malania oleifera TaxID=397392 RepID=UPI0025AE7951|nr:protein FREE1-like isoform X2 [Malania oleifera]